MGAVVCCDVFSTLQQLLLCREKKQQWGGILKLGIVVGLLFRIRQVARNGEDRRLLIDIRSEVHWQDSSALNRWSRGIVAKRAFECSRAYLVRHNRTQQQDPQRVQNKKKPFTALDIGWLSWNQRRRVVVGKNESRISTVHGVISNVSVSEQTLLCTKVALFKYECIRAHRRKLFSTRRPQKDSKVLSWSAFTICDVRTVAVTHCCSTIGKPKWDTVGAYQ